MARFLFVTWDGGGNQPPTIGIAQALSRRGNEVAFAGYRSQQDRFRAAGFDLLELPRSGGVDLDVAALSEQRPLVLTGVMASREHLGAAKVLLASGVLVQPISRPLDPSL